MEKNAMESTILEITLERANQLQKKLNELEIECNRLRKENERLATELEKFMNEVTDRSSSHNFSEH